MHLHDNLRLNLSIRTDLVHLRGNGRSGLFGGLWMTADAGAAGVAPSAP